MTEREPILHRTLRRLGCRKHRRKFFLDGFDHEFYLRFDTDLDEDNPKPETCDVIVVSCGEVDDGLRLLKDAKESNILRLIAALGISRFSEQTRKAFYELNGVIKVHGANPLGQRMVVLRDVEDDAYSVKEVCDKLLVGTNESCGMFNRSQVTELRDCLDHWLRTGRLPGGEVKDGEG